MTPPSVNSIGFVTKSNVENVQRLGGVICLETDAPLPDAQSILRRVHSREAPHVAGSLGGKLVDRARYPVGTSRSSRSRSRAASWLQQISHFTRAAASA